jgi:hypothetical protein
MYPAKMDLDASVFLQLANFALDTRRKDHFHLDYSTLFQPEDAYEQRYTWRDEAEDPLEESIETAYRTTLRTAIARLNLLGYSYHQIRDIYEESRLERDRNPVRICTPHRIRRLISWRNLSGLLTSPEFLLMNLKHRELEH